jgi:hypothetical protein
MNISSIQSPSNKTRAAKIDNPGGSTRKAKATNTQRLPSTNCPTASRVEAGIVARRHADCRSIAKSPPNPTK